MLPDYNTCIDRIKAYNQTGVYKKQIREISTHPPQLKFGFKDFWKYKTVVENEGCSILDAKYISDTALKLHDFLDSWGMRRSGIAEPKDIEQILNKIRPYYDHIQSVMLGSGQMCHNEKWIEAVYDSLDGITNLSQYPDGGKSSVTGKSKTLLALWGQTPGFDSLITTNFLKWSHSPAPLKLRQLRRGEEWYKPNEFFAMIVDLDEWVLSWSKHNNNRSFSDSFSNLCSGLPVGRIIDQVYNWEYEYDPLIYYLNLLKKQGRSEASLSFKELEGVLGFDLCKSAYEDPKWWEDNIVKLLEKAQKKAFKKGNYVWKKDKLDILGQNVHFVLS
jgi:hypothetical protein